MRQELPMKLDRMCIQTDYSSANLFTYTTQSSLLY